MRVLFLGNNWVGWQVVCWLREQGEEIVGVVVHPKNKRKYAEEIIHSAQVKADAVFDGACLQKPEVLSVIRELRPDIAVSVFFGYILRPPFLSLLAAGSVNLHPAFLPYNRGVHPNVWSIIDGTPAGVTLHYIDAGVDTGDIIAQRQVDIEPVDTGESLYHKLELACLDVFIGAWPAIRAGNAPRIPQPKDVGSCHRAKDLRTIDEIRLESSYTGKDLINLMRARTFPPHSGPYFWSRGRKVYLRLELAYEGES
jgi:methionyl-tRNA formyltransferase